MSILNCASSGRFSTDRTMREYNEEIWHLDEIPTARITPEPASDSKVTAG